MLKSKDADQLWGDLETIINKTAETKTTQAGWTYDVDAKGQYTLRFNGVVKGRGDHEAAMQRCRLSTAKARVETFGHNQNRRATTGDAVAAARLRKFQLDNELNARGV
jgi:hypothetical protein